MKIGIIQCDVTAGDIEGNAAKLASMARQDCADLCIAPACALAGPLPACVLRNSDFLLALEEGEAKLARALENSPPLLYGGANGPRLLMRGDLVTSNGACLVNGKRVQPLLADTFEVPPNEYSADLVCCLGAVPFIGSPPDYERMQAVAAVNGAPLVFANLTGGCDETIYAGASCVIDWQGRICRLAPAFGEEFLLVSFESGLAPCHPSQWHRTGAILDALILGTRDFVCKCGASSVLLGLSGGMDSALVAAIAAEALGPQNVAGMIMPSQFSSQASVTDALLLAENLGIRIVQLPIDELLASFEKFLKPAYDLFAPGNADLTVQNLQARIRSVLLAAASNRSGALVLNTGNKSEAAMGYFTLYGDSAGALAVIGDVYKTEVYELAEEFNRRRGKAAIPDNIFVKAPSAELAPGQKDSDSLPPYEDLDKALEKLLGGSRARDAAFGHFVRDKLMAMEFKRRQCPPALIVSPHPLAACRRPIAARMCLDTDDKADKSPAASKQI